MPSLRAGPARSERTERACAAAAARRRRDGRRDARPAATSTCSAAGARVHRRRAGPDAHRRRAADLRALVAPGARARLQGRVRARAWRTSTASPACCWGSRRGDGVLDVACGTGNFTRGFATRGGPRGPGGGHRRVRDHAGPGRGGHARAGLDDHTAYVRGERPGAAVPGPELRRRLLLRRAAPVRRPDARARPDDLGAHPGRPDRALHHRPRALGAAAHLRVGRRRAQRHAHVRAHARWCGALEQRGFADVRQRITGVTQFVGRPAGGVRLALRCPRRSGAGQSRDGPSHRLGTPRCWAKRIRGVMPPLCVRDAAAPARCGSRPRCPPAGHQPIGDVDMLDRRGWTCSSGAATSPRIVSITRSRSGRSAEGSRRTPSRRTPAG